MKRKTRMQETKHHHHHHHCPRPPPTFEEIPKITDMQLVNGSNPLRKEHRLRGRAHFVLWEK